MRARSLVGSLPLHAPVCWPLQSVYGPCDSATCCSTVHERCRGMPATPSLPLDKPLLGLSQTTCRYRCAGCRRRRSSSKVCVGWGEAAGMWDTRSMAHPHRPFLINDTLSSRNTILLKRDQSKTHRPVMLPYDYTYRVYIVLSRMQRGFHVLTHISSGAFKGVWCRADCCDTAGVWHIPHECQQVHPLRCRRCLAARFTC